MSGDFVYVEGEIPFYQSKKFNEHGIRHAFFTKKGGVSVGAFESLNFAVGTAEITDTEENVFENHARAASVFGLTADDICRSYQTHTDNVEIATGSDRGRGLTLPQYDRGVDGLVTVERDMLLSVRSADCVPILLCDTEKSVCGAVHAGWRGTVAGIAKNAVEKMVSLGARRENIIAAIGPCIGVCCYEVGRELYAAFTEKNGEYSDFFTEKGDKYMLDLNAANERILQSAGIGRDNISISHICTKCNSDKFFSHRVSGPVRGTMSAFICL